MKKEFSIDTEIYTEGLIQEGIEDFSEVANISYKNNILIIESDDELSTDEVFNEFMNYLLSL